MRKDELIPLLEDALNDAELKSGDIPAIDLYVDQIISLVSEKLSQGSERYRDRQLTKTMINNYSKDGLLTPVKGKKYSSEQITQILTIYSLKNTLSIGEIKRVLSAVYSLEENDKELLTSIYDRHIDVKHRNRETAEQVCRDIMERESLDIENISDYITMLCALVSLSAQLKNMAQTMIDAAFPEPAEPEKDKEKDKEKEKDKDKDKDKEKDKEKKSKEKNKEAKEKKKKNSGDNPSEATEPETETEDASAE